tara:strand:- start:2792 stop:3445 length:654 start_codon:yes stop_codon:yes gene_type:complete
MVKIKYLDLEYNLKMKEIYNLLFTLLFLMTIATSVNALNVNDHRIAILVNDQLITSYDIIQRMKMRAILNEADITPENSNRLANIAADELIKEKLKNEKLIEYGISIDGDEYIQHEDNFYNNISLSKILLTELFEKNNINYNEFKNYLIGEMSWQKLISGMYYRLTSASKIEIQEIMLKNPELTSDIAEGIVIQKQLDLKSSKMIRDMFNEATIEYK